MKKIMGTTAILLFSLLIAAQSSKKTINGIVQDAVNRSPLASATITIGNAQTLSNEKGEFVLMYIGGTTLVINSLGYKTTSLPLPSNPTPSTFYLTPLSLFLEPLEVKSIRASDKAPFAKTNIGKGDIVKQNLGTDIPFLLNQTPAVVVNSDAGNGIGYTGIRIRGTDATRVNVTLNGIPYNDAESMGTFFVNLPDFSSSVNSIQIQRGVGTSSNGASAFGATLNMSTNEFNELAYVELNNSYGSFNAWKNTLKVGSGLLGKHFTIDTRLSNITSDGFIERAKSNLQSFYLSTAYINNKSSIRLNVFSGKEKTYQSWYGVSEAKLLSNRRDNPAGTEKTGVPYDNQTDNYTQTHYQLFYNSAINKNWFFNTALFLTRGKGYYEEYKANQSFSRYGLPNPVVRGMPVTLTDLVRQRWLDNYFYGQIASFQYKNERSEITIGGGWSQYDGKHFGTLPWLQIGTATANYRYYDLTANKKDANIYAKWQYKILSHLTSFIDLQYRHVNHTMNGFGDNPTLSVSRKFNFINPKVGLTYNYNGWQAFVSYAVGNKEPNRDDFQASVLTQPKHETLNDWELGVEKKGTGYSYGATLYYMQYKNQLVLTGKVNDVGAYTRTNIAKSYRRGIELQGAVVVNKWLNASGNISFSSNKINSFVEYLDEYDAMGQYVGQAVVTHNNKDISFSPAVVSSFSLDFKPIKNIEWSLLNKYVSKQYLDNTQSENRKLNAFFVQDFRTIYTLKTNRVKEVQFIFQLNNIFNKKYEPNGYTFSYVYDRVFTTENFYYPMAGRNFMVALNVRL